MGLARIAEAQHKTCGRSNVLPPVDRFMKVGRVRLYAVEVDLASHDPFGHRGDLAVGLLEAKDATHTGKNCRGRARLGMRLGTRSDQQGCRSYQRDSYRADRHSSYVSYLMQSAFFSTMISFGALNS